MWIQHLGPAGKCVDAQSVGANQAFIGPKLVGCFPRPSSKFVVLRGEAILLPNERGPVSVLTDVAHFLPDPVPAARALAHRW